MKLILGLTICAPERNWWREVPDANRTEEEWWLAGHVYSAEANLKALGPIIERVTWHERYAPRIGATCR